MKIPICVALAFALGECEFRLQASTTRENPAGNNLWAIRRENAHSSIKYQPLLNDLYNLLPIFHSTVVNFRVSNIRIWKFDVPQLARHSGWGKECFENTYPSPTSPQASSFSMGLNTSNQPSPPSLWSSPSPSRTPQSSSRILICLFVIGCLHILESFGVSICSNRNRNMSKLARHPD